MFIDSRYSWLFVFTLKKNAYSCDIVPNPRIDVHILFIYNTNIPMKYFSPLDKQKLVVHKNLISRVIIHHFSKSGCIALHCLWVSCIYIKKYCKIKIFELNTEGEDNIARISKRLYMELKYVALEYCIFFFY